MIDEIAYATKVARLAKHRAVSGRMEYFAGMKATPQTYGQEWKRLRQSTPSEPTQDRFGVLRMPANIHLFRMGICHGMPEDAWAGPGDFSLPEIRKAWLRATENNGSKYMWFDFRGMPIARDALEIGFDMGPDLLRLPFPKCVFLVAKEWNGWHFDIAHEISDGRVGEISNAFFFSRQFSYYTNNASMHGEAEFSCRLYLMSRQADVTRKAYSKETNLADRSKTDHPSDVYRVVTLKPRVASALGIGIGHVSPRLHWRRGHFRRTSGGQTFVRAHLVGSAERGRVFKHYRVPQIVTNNSSLQLQTPA